MTEWKKTFCALCYHNCGLEIQTRLADAMGLVPEIPGPRTVIIPHGFGMLYGGEEYGGMSITLPKIPTETVWQPPLCTGMCRVGFS